MIVYGTRATVRPGQPLAQACPACSRSELQTFRVFDYFHVYYVPTFPLGSQAGVECTSCLHTTVGADVPEELTAPVSQAAQEAGRPRWHWAGTLLIALLISWLSIDGARENEANLARLASPVVGDLYVIDLRGEAEGIDPDMPFVVSRVEQVGEAEVTVRLGTWVYDTRWDAQKAVIRGHLKKQDYWAGPDWSFGREQLLSLEKQNKLKVARRAEEDAA